ncbi:GH116 family glycosyl hydrolase [Flavitalea flava]
MKGLSKIILVTAFCVFQNMFIYAQHSYNGPYSGEYLQRVAFPIGGMGAGMFCLEGTGAISHMSIRHSPEIFNEPDMFAAISLKGSSENARNAGTSGNPGNSGNPGPQGIAKVLEGPVPGWKKFGQWGAARGAEGTTFGLARFREAEFQARFPFGEVRLKDKDLPLGVVIRGWSPFIPTDADNSSLPVGGLDYAFTNTGSTTMEYVFSYNAKNFMALQNSRAPKNPALGTNQIRATPNGFILSQDLTENYPEQQGDFAIWTDEPASVDHCWFRGGWYDPLSMAWNKIGKRDTASVATVEKEAPGASLYVPFSLKPGETRHIRVLMAWYVPNSHLRVGAPVTKSSDSVVRDLSKDLPSIYHKPWYSSKFHSIGEVVNYWGSQYAALYKNTTLFSDAFYRSSMPPEVMEAISANLTILKSPTVMRQYDGRFWGWEGCNDNQGSCAGSCTHVWNYAQALSHLFPDMERSIRETEFREDMDSIGHQNYRAALPIRPAGHVYYSPAADGQLGGIMKTYRDWRISGDSAWLRRLYPKVKISLDYCIHTWDPHHQGTITEPHHNTYDIEFWGANGMITSFYLGALEAMIRMGEYLDQNVTIYKDLLAKGRPIVEHDLYNGEYFVQKIQWTGLNAPDPVKFAKEALDGGEVYSPEAETLLQKEGPKYQYGNGCLSDGVLGAWMARVCGLPEPLDSNKIRSHLSAVYKYNLKTDLSDYSNPQRPSFALGKEGGLLLCTWPKGGQLSLPFVYSNEVWTGVEYQAASHLIWEGKVKEGLDIVRNCRNRYDGKVRDPFDEYECGHWYARALSSYALLEALTGVRYDAVNRTLYVHSRMGDFTSFLSTATGFGNVVYSKGKATLKVVYGSIPVEKIVIAGQL